MLTLVVLDFGWGFLAADYFQNDPTSGEREANFWVNSVTQLSNLPGVLRHTCANRPGVLTLIAGAEVGVLIPGLVMEKVERNLSR